MRDRGVFLPKRLKTKREGGRMEGGKEGGMLD